MRRGAVAHTAFALGGLLALALLPAGGVAAPTFATYREEVVADAPASYWRLGEASGTTAADERGANPGTYAGGVALGRPSPLTTETDTSASFDGVDDSMLAPDSASLDMTAAVTLELWVRRNAVSARFETIVGKPGDGRSRFENYSLWLNPSDQFQAYWGNGSTFVYVLTPPVRDRRWHHVVTVHDGTTIRIYLDGVLAQSKTVTLRLTANANPLTVGRTLTNQTFFNGQVDELAVYPVALAPDRVAAHFAKGDVTAPGVTLVAPAGGSSSGDLTPTFTGVASTGAGDATTVVVNVWAGTTASGAPARTHVAGVQPDGSYSVEATPFTEGQWTARTEQVDSRGNVGESATTTFRLDATPPTTTISSKPANPSGSTSASFAFTANETATFECRLDLAAFAACTSPQAYTGLAQGAHAFEVRGRDPAGNTGSAAAYAWTVDTTPPPGPTIDSGPPATTNATTATFAFSDAEPDVTFECRRDGASFAVCTSPQAYSGLADGAHTFEVRARDAAANPSAPTSRSWTIDASPPPVPTIVSGPPPATATRTATFEFSDTEAGVAFECGLDGAAFASCSSPHALTGLADGPHTFGVRAVDAAGNASAAAARAWTIDATPPPAPAIEAGPPATTSSTSATFAFSDAEPGAVFECRLDAAPYATCTSPLDLTGLAEGTHVVTVRALDAAGNASAGTSRSWTVDTTPPAAPTIVSGPDALTSAQTATIAFSAAEQGVELECRLDDGAFSACTSPQTLMGIADGSHAFEVRARDTAGNASPASAHAWTVDATPPPAPTVDAAPPRLSADRSATFAFSDAEAGATFECRRDGTAFAACSSPKAYDGLADGAHSFEVRARDAAGNVSSATARAWTVDATPPPAPAIDSAPPPATSSPSATFAFSSGEPGVAFECSLDGAAFSLCTSPQLLTGLADGAHTFTVKARDAAGNASAPTSRAWTIDATPPPAPTIDSAPAGLTSSRSASFAFSDTEAGVDFACRLDGGSFAPCASPETFTALADGPHAFELEARDAAGNASARAVHSWTVDATPPPPPTIDSGPSGVTSATSATFVFAGSEPGAGFECRLDGGAYATCTSPHAVSGLVEGSHTFEVRARDGAGNAGDAASRSWTVDLTPPPAPTIDSGPPAVTTSSSATFTFSDVEAGVTFECRLDAADFGTCTSPELVTGLSDGEHTFAVRARDAVGNASAATSRSWTVDATPPPAPAIVSAPPARTASTDATFGFSSGEPGATFECRLDGAPFAACASPTTFTDLADGPHGFEVRARDAAGNTSAASSHAWTIDATPPPVPTIESGPSGTTNATAATLVFSGGEPGTSFECRLDGAPFAACTSPHDVTGLADGAHVVDVRARDEAGNASAPASRSWTVDTANPVVTLTAPADGSVTADATPTLAGAAGTATGDVALVEIELWAGDAPTGPAAHVVAAARRPDATFSGDAPLLTEGRWTARARQADAAGNVGTSNVVVFTVQLDAPAVTITSAPADPSTSTSASFGFTATGAVTFECGLDGAAFAACTSPHEYSSLAPGPHTFDVRARSAAGAVGAPTRHAWTIAIPGPPAPTITAGPANPTVSTSAGFTFSAGPPAVGFECRLDGAPFEPCTSPKGYGALPYGPRLFEVRSLDASGNASDPARHEWTIIAPPPLPQIDSGPPNPTTSGTATFTFSDSEPGVTFDCTLDGSPPTACSSPKTYTGVPNGAHTFTVKAVKAQGGRSEQVPYRWTVDSVAPPAPSLDSSTEGASASFGFADGGTPASPALGAALPPRLPRSTGATFYVSTTGSDSAPGTEAQPWRTVQKALDALGPGQRALVSAGTYTEDLEFARSGTASEPITVAAATGETVVLHAASTSPDTFPVQITGSYFRLQGFVVENAVGESSANVYLHDGAHHVELLRNEIRFSQDQGVFADETTSEVHVIGNRVHDNGLGHVEGQHQSHGLYLEGANDLVANNVVYRHPFGFGVQLYPRNTGTLVVGNTVVASGQSGVLVGGPEGVADITIRNNVFAYNRLYGVDHDDDCPTGPVRVDHNVIWGNRNGTVHGSCPATIDVSGGNVLAQPSFVDEDGPDYRLLPGSGSPGLDAALAEYALPDDVDGVLRPRGPAPDMGGHENGVRFECRLDGAPFAACASALTFAGLATGAHTFEVRAVDGAGNAGAATGHSWTVDFLPPATPTITAGPAALTNSGDAALEFTGEAGVTFECRLDDSAFASCTSPHTYNGLADGSHTFAVRAVDAAGNPSTAATRSWTVDATPPGAPAIGSAPPAATSSRTATLAFSGEAGVTFECGLDGAALGACTSPATYTGLADGSHAFEVRATDAAGNTGPSATATWTVDATPPPAPSITSGPASPTVETEATFAFGDAEPGVTFECRLDTAAFGPCSSPTSYSGLAAGAHTFAVRAVDAVANRSAATTVGWTISPPPSGSGPPRVRAASSNALNVAASIALALPAGTAQGDLLLAIVAHQGGTARNMTPPAGWTAVANGDFAQGTNARIHAWYRAADADEPASYTFTLTGGSAQDTAGGILAISGARAPLPIEAAFGQANATNSTSVTAPSIAPAVPNALLVFGGAAAGAVTSSPPAGMTEQLDRATTGTYKIATSVATQELAATGATGTRAATISSAVKSAALSIAIAPA